MEGMQVKKTKKTKNTINAACLQIAEEDEEKPNINIICG